MHFEPETVKSENFQSKLCEDQFYLTISKLDGRFQKCWIFLFQAFHSSNPSFSFLFDRKKHIFQPSKRNGYPDAVSSACLSIGWDRDSSVSAERTSVGRWVGWRGVWIDALGGHQQQVGHYQTVSWERDIGISTAQVFTQKHATPFFPVSSN